MYKIQENGFTFIEVFIVIAILGILTLICVPQILKHKAEEKPLYTDMAGFEEPSIVWDFEELPIQFIGEGPGMIAFKESGTYHVKVVLNGPNENLTIGKLIIEVSE